MGKKKIIAISLNYTKNLIWFFLILIFKEKMLDLVLKNERKYHISFFFGKKNRKTVTSTLPENAHHCVEQCTAVTSQPMKRIPTIE